MYHFASAFPRYTVNMQQMNTVFIQQIICGKLKNNIFQPVSVSSGVSQGLFCGCSCQI